MALNSVLIVCYTTPQKKSMGNVSASATGSLRGDVKRGLDNTSKQYIPPEVQNIINDYTMGECEYVPDIELECERYYNFGERSNANSILNLKNPFDSSRKINCLQYCLERSRQKFMTLLDKHSYAYGDFLRKNPNAILTFVAFSNSIGSVQMQAHRIVNDSSSNSNSNDSNSNSNSSTTYGYYFHDLTFDDNPDYILARPTTVNYYYKVPVDFDYSKMTATALTLNIDNSKRYLKISKSINTN